MKQLLHDFLSHPWVDCKEAADGADGRAECGKRGTSWGPSRYRYRKSATAAPSVTDVPVALPSLIFDFVLGTSPSWSPKVYALHGRTLLNDGPPQGSRFWFHGMSGGRGGSTGSGSTVSGCGYTQLVL